MNLTGTFRALPKAASLAPAMVYGFAGIAFILGTLIMSFAMDSRTFAEATLLIAISNLAAAAAPAGMNGIVLRYNLRTDWRLLSIGFALVAISALATSVVAFHVYDLTSLEASVLFASVFVGGMAFSAIPKLQRRQHFVSASFVSQSAAFWMLLAAGIAVFTEFGRQPWFPIALMTIGFLVCSIAFFKPLTSHRRTDVDAKPRMWKEAAHFWGIALSSELMSQLERLFIPLLLGLEAVGSFAVVAAVAIAPYRVIELATATTLVTRLQAAPDARRRLQVFYREALLLVPVSVGGGAILLFVGLPICQFVHPDGNDITYAVLAMGAFSGFCRVLTSLARSVSSAFCTVRELAVVNGISWLAIAAGVVVAWAMTGLGLAGVIFGFAVGWLLRAVLTAAISFKYLHSDAAIRQAAAASPQLALQPKVSSRVAAKA